ncbi:hypothetical protein [Sphingomonas sp. Leaf38]|uniref:hypothetical protein n=1 Tax=Sphingomonas sp. Leaf38 TaxID=1736217 RepID=UPI0006FC242F|nr:hypothetical protein [Sphingomonas sp. Leaf38]KQN32683.1 hypothetical protein ASE88_01405 [Sphingomonas sp. Leaf38]
MRGDYRLTTFASGCGDSILIEAHDKVVMIDIHYRAARAQDDEDDEAPDFASDIRQACGNDHLDVFVSTHPDKDHVGGFSEIFHCGSPETWDSDPDDSDPKIIVDEIWCSPYGLNPHYTTDQSKPLTEEIKRRYVLQSTDAGYRDGNRLKVMDTSKVTTGSIATDFEWRLLAPTPAEWDIPKAPEGCTPTSSNPTSLVIQWTVRRYGGDNLILTCGDTSVEVLERLEKDIHRKNPHHLAWQILLAPHHCSRRSIGRVPFGGCTDGEFVESTEALKALGEQRGNGYVVSSSRRVVRGGDTPPSWHAKRRYLRILANGGEINGSVEGRFRCTGGNGASDLPAHIVFNLTMGGPTLAPAKVSAAVGLGGGGAAVGGGGSYG